MTVALQVSARESLGSAQSRRDRIAGKVPAILYGHGGESVALTVNSDALKYALKKHAHVVTLAGAVDQQALIRDVQFDCFGVEILHVDFGRVSQGEKLVLSLPVHLRGEAPAGREGALVTHVLHEVEVSCPVASVPEDLSLDITGLHLGQSLHASDIKLPEGVELVTDAGAVVVVCAAPAAEVEPTGGPVEPQIVDEKGKSEEGDEA